MKLTAPACIFQARFVLKHVVDWASYRRASDNLGGMSRFYALGVLVLACATERQPNVTDEERRR